MVISSKVWLALSENAKLSYLRMYGKVLVDFGDYQQEIRLESFEKKVAHV
jgi:hypothetical protein